MTKIIPTSTKQYLVSSIETRISNSPQDFVFTNKKLYEEKYNSESFKKPQGGFGVGTRSGTPKKQISTTEIMMGDTSGGKEDDSWYENPILKAAGLGVLGGVVKTGADYLGGILKNVGIPGVGNVGRAVASLGKQAEELSGKTWFEQQLSKIGKSSMQLAASGAGSPWTPFEIPEKKPTELISPEERRLQDLSKRVQVKKLQTKAQQLGLTP